VSAALSVLAFSVLGAGVSAVLACLPGLHVYNVMGLAVLAVHAVTGGAAIAPAAAVPFATGLIVGYAMLSAIPSILLAAPDESALFMVMPGQKYLMAGRGLEAVMLTGTGGLAGLALLLAVVGPAGPYVLPTVRRVAGPHQHWILWCVICFMLQSEWPKGGRRGRHGWARLGDAWRSLAWGLATFLLSGLLGFILLYRSPLGVDAAFQNLMPAFVGLFTLPWLLLNLAAGVDVPPQAPLTRAVVPSPADPDHGAWLLKGVTAGALGGGFAAFFPVVTGGVGGFLAGHATAMNSDRAFLVSQGTSKLVYYVGGFLFFFVPGLRMVRGGGAAMLSGMYVPAAEADAFMALAAAAFAGAVSILLLQPLTALVLDLIRRVGYRRLSLAALGLVLLLVVAITGLPGLLVTLTATGIGLLPVLCGSRRLNALGVVLLPLACMMSGFGPAVARVLGLL